MSLSKYHTIKSFLGKFSLKSRSSPNLLKFGAGLHFYILISNLIFSFSKFLSLIFFGLIWSQNLKFSRLTEIWDKHTFLYACYNVNFYFSKIFATDIFLGQFGPTIWISLKWLKFCRGVNCCMLITILMFIFSKFLSVIFFWAKLVAKFEVFQIDWNFVQGNIPTCRLRFSYSYFLGKFNPKV